MNSKMLSALFNIKRLILSIIILLIPCVSFAGEAELNIPVFSPSQNNLLMVGFLVCIIGMGFGIFMYKNVKVLPAHKSMLDIADVIFQTCKTYLIQQGKLLVVLEIFVGLCITYYFGFLQHMHLSGILLILGWSIAGILGSYSVAWFCFQRSKSHSAVCEGIHPYTKTCE